MQNIILFALAFAGLCSAQSSAFTSLPDCAKSCALNSIPKNCNLDVKCICADTSFIKGIACCVSKGCSPGDVQKSLTVAQQLCSTVSVTVDPNIPSDCGAASGSGASSAPSSSGASSTATGSAASAGAATATSASVTSQTSNAAGHFSNDIGLLGAGIIAAALL